LAPKAGPEYFLVGKVPDLVITNLPRAKEERGIVAPVAALISNLRNWRQCHEHVNGTTAATIGCPTDSSADRLVLQSKHSARNLSFASSLTLTGRPVGRPIE
jgi:hypothetical protein